MAQDQNLANLYRPRTFGEMVGQELAVTTLKRIAHADGIAARALFLKGEFGCGKSTVARVFGKAMNCVEFKHKDDVCNACAGCQEASASNSSLYWELDGTVVGNIEGIRRLKEQLMVVPEGRRVVVLDEVQSCFYHKTSVTCVADDGSLYQKPIADIVNNRLKVNVLSSDPYGHLCVRPVTGWFRNPSKPLCKVTLRGLSGLQHLGDGSKTVVCTLDHKFLCLDGVYRPVSDLAVGSLVQSFHRVSGSRRIHAELNKRIVYTIPGSVKSFLYGSFLGGLTIDRAYGSNSSRVRCCYGPANRFLLLEYHRILGALTGTISDGVRHVGSKDYTVYIMNSLRSSAFDEFSSVCYNIDGVREVNLVWLSRIGVEGLASWYMHSGSCSSSYDIARFKKSGYVRFTCGRFTDAEITLLQSWLQNRWGFRFAVKSNPKRSKSRVLQASGAEALGFLSLIAPYVLCEFSFKLPGFMVAGNGLRQLPCITVEKPSYYGGFLYPGEITAVEPFEDLKRGKYPYDYGYTYDLEVADTHSYIVGSGFVAHNCSKASQDALLKTVEEGVPNTIFMFCGTEDISPTLKSRCVNIDISTIPLPLVEAHVAKIAASRGTRLSADELHILAMKSDGHMRNALQLLQFYELAGPRALDSSYFKFRDFIVACFSKSGGTDPSSLLSDLLLYPTIDVRMSVGLLLRNIYATTDEGSVEFRLQKAGLGKTLFGFFFSPLAQQALGSEVGVEVLLRSLIERTASTRSGNR